MASPALRITPARNSAPEATTCTAGIASASAQGQVMISTAIAVTTASCSEAPASQPAGEGRRRGQMHHRRIEARGAVGKPHGARFGARRLLQQPLDFVEQRGAVGRGHPHGERAGIVQAAGIDGRAGGDLAPRGLAGDQAFVDLGSAAEHAAVGRHALAGFHQHPVARLQRGDRHRNQFTAGKAVRGFRLQRRQIAGDRPRLAPHGVVERAPDQEKEQQHDRGIEIGVPWRAAPSRPATCRAPGSRRARSARPC